MFTSASVGRPITPHARVATLLGSLALLGQSACISETLPDDAEQRGEDVADEAEALSYGGTAFILANGFDGITRECTDYSVPGPCQYTWYNTHGGVRYERVSRGMYKVTFRGLGQVGGNAQIVATDSSGTLCKVVNWYPSGGDQVVNVRCHLPTNGQENSSFIARFVIADGGYDGQGAYLWAGQPSTATYTPAAAYSWNSSGGVNQIQRLSAGYYAVTLPGLTATGGSVEVTAYGAGDATHCKVQNWYPNAEGTQVNVRCFNVTTPVDAKFSMNYLAPKQVGAFNYGAYTWAHDSTSAYYIPNTTYSYNSGPCTERQSGNSVERIGLGDYRVRHDELQVLKSIAHVTAYGADANYCTVSGVSAVNSANLGLGTRVNVSCFTGEGYKSDSRFVETFSSGQRGTFCGTPPSL
ncbi:MAG: hypothetical protein AB7K71_23915 [Polyangiaceae bacterium]